MAAMLLMLAASIVCWYFALSQRARDEHSKPLRHFYRSKEYSDVLEACGFAAALIGALFFTTFFLALLIMRIAAWF